MFLFSKFDFLRRPIWFAGMLVRCFHHLIEEKKPLSTSCLPSLDFYGEDEILEFAFPYDVTGKTCLSLFDGPAPLLKSLHLIPVIYRIAFKICTVAYQALTSMQLEYLHSLLIPAKVASQLRSSHSLRLLVYRFKTNIGFGYFSVAYSMEVTP